MCLLTYFPEGVMPDADALRNGATWNDDGHGYAIVDVAGNRIIVDRGMDAKEMIRDFAVIRAAYPDGPALFHSRLATDGTVNLLNVHPFPVGGDSRTVLAHNGIMPLRPPKHDPRSDTRVVAEEHIPRAFTSLRRRRARLAFQRWMGAWNKVVILTVDPRFRGHGFILNEEEGMWDDGVWYSNNAYQGYYPSAAYTYTWDKEWDRMVPKAISASRALADDHVHACWACQESVDYTLGECPKCGICFDCGEMPFRCLCYVPSRRLDHQGT